LIPIYNSPLLSFPASLRYNFNRSRVESLFVSLRLVKPASDFARRKIQVADKRLKEWGLRGAVLLLLAVPVGVAVGLLDSFSGFVVGLVLGATGLVLVLIGFTLWMEASSTRKGWEGEQRVASELSYLNDDFLLLNDVVLWGGRGNIDHIVVGPTGVFVIETKNYSGKYVCYGDRWFFQGVRQKYDVASVSVQAKNNANALSTVLHRSGFTVEVNPIIVFTHPSVQLWLHHPTVPVLKSGTVCNFLLNQQPRFKVSGPYSQKVAEKILLNDRTPHQDSSIKTNHDLA